MNNEEKILSALETLSGRFDGFELSVNRRFDGIDQRLDGIDRRLDAIESDVAVLKEDVSVLKEDVEEIKEDTGVTRDATNQLIEWAELAGKALNIPFVEVNADFE